LRSAILATHHPTIRGQWAGIPQLLSTHVATGRRKYIGVLPDAGAITIRLLVLLGVLLAEEANIALLLVITRVLLGTRVLIDHLLGIMILLPRDGLEL
jgi:hypothetical protein